MKMQNRRRNGLSAGVVVGRMLLLASVGVSAYGGPLEDPWTPGGGPSSGEISEEIFKPGTTPEEIPAGEVSTLTDIMRDCGASGPADEIDAAVADGSVKVMSYESNGGEIATTSADGKTVGIASNTEAGSAGSAARLLHEWCHVRGLGGRFGDPTSVADELNPCHHIECQEIGMALLCRLRCEAKSAEAQGQMPDPPFGDGDLGQLARGESNFVSFARECAFEVNGLDPALLSFGQFGSLPEPPCRARTPCGPGDGCN